MNEICGNCVHCISSGEFALCRAYHFQRPKRYADVFDYHAADKARKCSHYMEHTPFYDGELREIKDFFKGWCNG